MSTHPAPPAPGLRLGDYPQRLRQPAAPLAGARLMARLALLRGAGPARLRSFVASVRRLEAGYAVLPDAARAEQLQLLRARMARDGLGDALLAPVLALISLACRRTLGMTPRDTQLAAAHILLNRQLAEMATGEGKTLAAGIAALAAAMAGVPVHVLTANDYLVGRDAAMLRPLAGALGLSVGAVTQPMGQAARQGAYRCDIAYCTARELVFDYLRDGLLQKRGAASGRLLRGLCMAIVDEADAILIDEARIPLVLSQQQDDAQALQSLAFAWRLSARLESRRDYRQDGARAMLLTGAGRARLQELAGSAPPWPAARRGEDLMRLALTARHLLIKGVHYHVREGKVCLIDDTTGRNAEGRSWSGGLQQMVEMKEACRPTAAAVSCMQITYQRFFPRYLWLCGMSGTLAESRSELYAVYRLPVRQVRLHRPARRTLLQSGAFASIEAQWQAVAEKAAALRASGRPVLIGTDTVSDSEALSQRLSAAGLTHAVLNARCDQHEAAVVAAAGAAGAITVATSMAGRGTDIVLSPDVAARGGLHVICCQQNGSPRMDRQLIGRCARQGEPGSAERAIALDGRLLARRPQAAALRWLAGAGADGWLARCAGLAALLALRAAQRAEQRRDRHERRLLLQRDTELAGWLSFSGPAE
ncbi:MAG: DEAD/DEAH box helicase [Noviherbaspirillum sp.]